MYKMQSGVCTCCDPPPSPHTHTHSHSHLPLLRPVKVIRLISRHTVEEIVLKRAHTKLELTNTVIEGGQVGVAQL